MKEVEAVKSTGDILYIGKTFQKHYSLKVFCIWELGLNLALRISDLLDIKYTDIKDGYVSIIESKTNKEAKIHLNTKAIDIIQTLKEANPNDVYLFQATGNRVSEIKPLSRQYVTKAFKEVADIVGIHIGTHSMRKTRGYHLFKKTNNITSVMKMLRHSNQGITLRYIGITQDDIDKDFAELVL